MLQSGDNISHPGIVQAVGTDKISVLILSKSACSACDSKTTCLASEMEEKLVDVPNLKNKDYKIGEHVTISMHQSSGNQAVLLGYFLPFIVLISSLIFLVKIGLNEGIAGLLGLVSLGVYYVILSLCSKNIAKKFQFYIQ